jgi:7-carboxy-7-deazaguanine synthase
MKVKVSEIFYSISGEGMSVGTPTVFIRLAGCSLRCGMSEGRPLWCDTGYALSFEKGEEMDLEKVIQRVEKFSQTSQILLTGGEPLEGEEKRKFCLAISKYFWEKRHNHNFAYTRVETNGKEDIREFEHCVFTLDYKLPGSGMEKWMLPSNFFYLRDRKNSLDEIKFVVRDKADFKRALEVIEEYKLTEHHLLFSPVEKELQPSILAEWVKKAKLPNSRLSLQIHKILWGNKRGV